MWKKWNIKGREIIEFVILIVKLSISCIFWVWLASLEYFYVMNNEEFFLMKWGIWVEGTPLRIFEASQN